MNTNAALAALLDLSQPFEEREELYYSLLYSDDAELDRPLLVSSIIKSKVEDGIRDTAIMTSPTAPSYETVSLLRAIIEDSARPPETMFALVALTTIERLNAIPMLKSILAGNEEELRNTALVALQYLPIEAGNPLFRDVVNNPSFSRKNRLVAAFTLAKQGDDSGRDVFRSALASNSLSRIHQVMALCGLVYLKDIEGIRRLTQFLRSAQQSSPESERDIDRNFRLNMLKHLCGFVYEEPFKDCTAEAIEHLERLV